MIEPPCQALVRRVFKINDRILVSVELVGVKGIAGTMHCGRKRDLSSTIDRGMIKFAEYRRGRDAVEAVAVVEYP